MQKLNEHLIFTLRLFTLQKMRFIVEEIRTCRGYHEELDIILCGVSVQMLDERTLELNGTLILHTPIDESVWVRILPLICTCSELHYAIILFQNILLN